MELNTQTAELLAVVRCHRCGGELTPITTYTRFDGVTYHLDNCEDYPGLNDCEHGCWCGRCPTCDLPDDQEALDGEASGSISHCCECGRSGTDCEYNCVCR